MSTRNPCTTGARLQVLDRLARVQRTGGGRCSGASDRITVFRSVRPLQWPRWLRRASYFLTSRVTLLILPVKRVSGPMPIPWATGV